MKTSTQVRKEATAPAVAKQGRKPRTPPTERDLRIADLLLGIGDTKQAASASAKHSLPVCDPNEIAKDWVLLRLGNDDGDGNLWASREGLLYLWHNDQAYHLPRVVSTAEAQRWIAEHGEDRWCEPYFPEDSPAYELVNVPSEAKEIEGEARVVSKGSGGGRSDAEHAGATPPPMFLRMEKEVQQAMALLELFSTPMALAVQEDRGAEGEAVARGCQDMDAAAARTLFQDWQAACAQGQKLYAEGIRMGMVNGQWPPVFRLLESVAEAALLITQFAEELDERGEDRDREEAKREGRKLFGRRTGYITMSRRCCEALHKSFELSWDEWDALDKQVEQRQAA